MYSSGLHDLIRARNGEFHATFFTQTKIPVRSRCVDCVAYARSDAECGKGVHCQASQAIYLYVQQLRNLS